MNSNSKLKRKKKTHGPGNPSKRHRDRLNAELDNLARLLPFPEETVTKLDKISILRLTVSYLRAKSFFQVNGKNGQEETCEDLVREFEGNGLFSQLSLEALDGFIVVITQEGQLFYVSENVRDFLGYSQAAVIHQSIFKFLHIDDQDIVKLKLAWPFDMSKDNKIETETARRRDSVRTDSDKPDMSEIEKLNRSFTCRMKCTLNHGGGFYKLFRLCGRLRAIQTRKRDNDVVEYGLFAICSPAQNIANGSTSSAVKKDVTLTAQKRVERTTSDPLGNRRPMYPSHAMMRPTHVGPFLYPATRPPFTSPLGSPTASSDSSHPSPLSTTMKPPDVDMQSDMSDLSNSSKSSIEADARDRIFAASQARLQSMIQKSRAFGMPDGDHHDDPSRKRSRSVADASDLQASEYELMRKNHQYGFAAANLPSIAEVKNENRTDSSSDDTKSNHDEGKAEGRRPVGSYDSRLDAARGLMNLGGMPLPIPSLYPFPEFMYPDVIFPRFDGMSMADSAHIRSPFDVHNPCCMSRDQYNQLAMRRWLSTPDMLRSPLNPLLAAQTALMSPVDRMRYFQMPFPFGFPFPSPSHFEIPSTVADRSMAELRPSRPEVASTESTTSTSNETDVKKEDDKSPDSSPVKAPDKESNFVKEEKEENGTKCAIDSENQERGGVPVSQSETANGDPKMQQANGDDKSSPQFRVNLKGIQAEFTNRLECLDRSFCESFGGLGKKDK